MEWNASNYSQIITEGLILLCLIFNSEIRTTNIMFFVRIEQIKESALYKQVFYIWKISHDKLNQSLSHVEID
jgi:hypothetical protein